MSQENIATEYRDNIVEETNKITKKDLRGVFWRGQINQLSSSYDRGMSLSTLYTLTPVLKRLYEDKPKDQRVAAQKRHVENRFGTHPVLMPFIMGVTVAMEESTDEDEKDSVIAVRTSLMGPLAGVGDSLLNFTWMPIAGSIGATFAIQGNPIGPFLMFLMINLLYWPIKYYGLNFGYTKGRELLTGVDGRAIIDRITNAASVVGVMVASSLVVSTVSLELGIIFGEGDNAIVLQEMIDQVMPGLLPVGLTVFCYYFTKKFEGQYITRLILGLIVVAVILSGMGVIV